MSHARSMRILGILFVFLAVAGVMGCDRIRDAVDGLRRSTGDGWEQGRRRLGR